MEGYRTDPHKQLPTDTDPGGLKTSHPTDPDQEHWEKKKFCKKKGSKPGFSDMFQEWFAVLRIGASAFQFCI
jgi:hypothetical protein